MSVDRNEVVREVIQRLEALRRAGLDRLAVDVTARAPGPSQSPVRGVPATAVREPAPPPLVPPPAPPAVPGTMTAGVTRPPAVSPPVVSVPSLFEEASITDPAVAPGERTGLLAALAAEVAACERCPHLAASRTQTVFGDGDPNARLMFIGEAPGAEEDRTGLPFVGRAGELLNDMITKGMGLSRGQVYIANVLKSRPPENRNPLPDEVAHCLPYLDRQIAIVRPEFLCILGKVAASALLDTAMPLGKLRGRWHRVRGIPAIVTYHPAFLLRNPASKKEAWDDLQLLMKAMGLTPPGRKKV